LLFRWLRLLIESYDRRYLESGDRRRRRHSYLMYIARHSYAVDPPPTIVCLAVDASELLLLAFLPT
jgi:hypothetical protein